MGEPIWLVGVFVPAGSTIAFFTCAHIILQYICAHITLQYIYILQCNLSLYAHVKNAMVDSAGI